jgi:phosphoribosylformylglycinamidine synthase
MVYRIFVEKKPGLDNEARELRKDARTFLGIRGLEKVRLLNRYDAEDMPEELFNLAVREVFSEPQLDDTSAEPDTEGAAAVFAVEYLPGQFDQRADSAAQCVQFISRGERPLIRSAKVYILYGKLTEEEILEIKKYVINPVEAREASLEKPQTLRTEYAVPTEVATLEGFTALDRAGLEKFVADYGLAMDADDIAFCQSWFREEGREPTITEIRMLDTYWSDHCRHTTFLTEIDSARFEDEVLEKSWKRYLDTRKALGRENRPVCLMDLATVAAKYLRKNGKLDKLDESEEINACTVKMDVERDGVKEPWLLLFKNETHNHPTEIEPFGGAATCIGGAIRDPLSGRAYVYGAMRVTGAADPTRPVSETIPGKLPQRKLVTTAAAGYASYGNQIGLATGIVEEIYHPGYAAKRMEIGAVIAAAPAENVRRECPAPGDVVILLGGSTGRDGIGGATGSSKAHNARSVETCGAEVQKGNAPEERKLQRLFRNPKATKLIKRCNDFGAGGVSVAIGELADGLDIDLNAVPKKYEGLDGTELAISESQERMAVVVAAEDAEAFLELAAEENLQACPVAKVKAEPRLTMRWNGKTIVDISRDFLNSNGAPKHTVITPAASKPATAMNTEKAADFAEQMKKTAEDLAVCSRRGLSERFDSTIGAGSVLMPFGGKHQLTPVQAMVQKISLEKGHTDDCSLMAWGYDPELTSFSPYHGAYLAVVDSVSKLIASGASFRDVYLTFQEYFEKPGGDGRRWGKPLAALLGAFDAQMDLGIAAIGGKDSMSGSFEKLDVPPTLVSFAVTTAKTGDIISSEFKEAGHPVMLLEPERDERGLPVTASLLALYDRITEWIREGKIVSCRTIETGGSLASVMKMALGNGLGFAFEKDQELSELAECRYGSFIAEAGDSEFGIQDSELSCCEGKNQFSCQMLGTVLEEPVFTWREDSVTLKELRELGRNKLEKVYPTLNPEWTPEDRAEADACWPAVRAKDQTRAFSFEAKSWPAPAVRTAKPRVLIPAFPGTNCEIDSARAMEDAGAEAKIFVVRNRTAEEISRSAEAFADEVRKSQMIFIPGGFSGGDEPDGSAKFITAFFRNGGISEAVSELLEKRDGLMCGICNGFQALIKLGLVPYGKIIETDEHCPTLTFNTIGRHQSRIVRTRVASTLSPWLRGTKVGEVYSVPISHGEGRFLAEENLIRELEAKGQIATQYVDLEGQPSMDLRFNPNGSLYAIEGITSPDGRVFGKMGHSERTGKDLYKNVPGNYDIGMFRSAVEYFK